MFLFLASAAVVFVYSLPPAIAYARRCRAVVPLTLFSIALGWTGVGWIFALVWACFGAPKPRIWLEPEEEANAPPAPPPRPIPSPVERSFPPLVLAAPEASEAPRAAPAARQAPDISFAATQSDAAVIETTPAAPRPKRRRTKPVDEAELLATLEKATQQIATWESERRPWYHDRSPEAAGRIEMYSALLAAARKEARRARKLLGDKAPAEPEPTNELTLRTSNSGHAYYKNGPPSAPRGVDVLRNAGIWGEEYALAGCSYRQAELDRVAGGRRGLPVYFRTLARIRAEPDNPHDANAVALDVGGFLIGYIPRTDAPRFRAELGAVGKLDGVLCHALIENGAPDWRAKIEVERPLRL